MRSDFFPWQHSFPLSNSEGDVYLYRIIDQFLSSSDDSLVVAVILSFPTYSVVCTVLATNFSITSRM